MHATMRGAFPFVQVMCRLLCKFPDSLKREGVLPIMHQDIKKSFTIF